MIWIAPTEQDAANAALEKHLWAAAQRAKGQAGNNLPGQIKHHDSHNLLH